MLDIVITCNLLTDIFPVDKDTTSALIQIACMKGLLISYLEPVMRRRTFIKNIILSALWVSMQFLYKNNNMTLYVGIIDQCLDFIVLPIVIVKRKKNIPLLQSWLLQLVCHISPVHPCISLSYYCFTEHYTYPGHTPGRVSYPVPREFN